MERIKARLTRTSPSLHLLLLFLIFGAAFVGYVAVIWSAELRGYAASTMVAARDLALVIPIIAVFLWLTRKQRYRGEMMMLTAAVFLFSFGLVIQFRLFSDPEYAARGAARARAREAKAQTVRLLNVETGYDDEKKTFMFGAPDRVPQLPEAGQLPGYKYSLADILSSANTYIPIVALLAMAACFRLFKDDRVLLWFQRHAMILGFATLVPFAIIVLSSDDGKFFKQTTPWEAVKILFLLSFAGVLADAYRHLRLTRWGLPPVRHLLPFIVIAVMPVLPFFALSDFGQMLVFLGVYVMLYVVAVRSKAQVAYAVALVSVLFVVFFGATKVTTGFGVPGRVYFRFYQWAHTWEAPPPETWWWKRDLDRYLQAKNLTLDVTSPNEIKQRNNEAWADKVLQQSQALFGVDEGGAVGEGLGLGFPETVPISDSDFIYAAIAEETGLAGGLAILLGLSVFVFAGTAVSISASDMFTKLLAAGITAFVGFQAIVNIGGVLRFLPMTGITLPFVSHGGWSLITSFSMLGVLLALSHRNAVARKALEAPPQPAFVPVR
ncbi:MAG TPA: FtsW/RodA/SpoVE family cell cycle protein [Blastocatellia bacterium]|nr:FtsW/RodA/SpoVE family cell cycle protein [Blastocatellia bacterium]